MGAARGEWALIAAGVAVACLMTGTCAIAYQRHVAAAKPVEALVVLQMIAASEGVTLASRLAYVDCPGGAYPRAVPGPKAHPWSQPSHPGDACWQSLVSPDSDVRFVYRVVVGGPSDPVPAPPKSGLTMPMPTRPWFVAMASADLDGDGDLSSYWVTSFAPGVSSVDPDE